MTTLNDIKANAWVLRRTEDQKSIAKIKEGKLSFRQPQLWDLYRGGIAVPVDESKNFGGLTLVPPNSEYFPLAFFRYSKIHDATWEREVPPMPSDQ